MEKIIIDQPHLTDLYAKELALFFKLYEANFPDVNEREDPQVIAGRIKLDSPEKYYPETTIILVVSGDKVMGGSVVEYYAACKCFLLTYILVDNEFRGQGVSRFLVGDGIRSVVEAKGKELVKAVFFESNIPWKTLHDSFDPWERFRVFSKLGAKWIDLDYTQPSLGKGRNKVHNLSLFMFPSLTGLKDKIRKSDLVSFLEVFYQALGITEPGNDPDFKKMIESIPGNSKDKSILLKELPRKERDDFRFSDLAVACHFAERATDKPLPKKNRNGVSCPVMDSYESDLLLYRYQENRPFRTWCLSEAVEYRCLVHFPEFTTFTSEGRHESLHGAAGALNLNIKISSTFYTNQRRIWTLVFSPTNIANVSQDVVIKLISLFSFSPENNNIAKDTRFDFEENQGLKFDQFIHLVAGKAAASNRQLFKLVPRELEKVHSGIVQVNAFGFDDDKKETVNVGTVIGLIDRISKNDAKASQELQDSYRENKGMSLILNLLCGFSLGIFDYSRMSFDEVMDTLRPITSNKDSVIFLNKGILTAVSFREHAGSSIQSSIGINPYLLISSSVLAFDDCESAEAEYLLDKTLDEINDKEKVTPALTELINVRKRLQRVVNEEILTNVFHYPTERITLEHGLSHRGIKDRIQNIRNRLNELNSVITDQIERDNKRNKIIVALLLTAISILGLEAFFGRIYGSIQSYGSFAGMWEKEGAKWMVFFPVSIVMFSLIAYFTIRDLKKRG
jgi:hypothetical protein